MAAQLCRNFVQIFGPNMPISLLLPIFLLSPAILSQPAPSAVLTAFQDCPNFGKSQWICNLGDQLSNEGLNNLEKDLKNLREKAICPCQIRTACFRNDTGESQPYRVGLFLIEKLSDELKAEIELVLFPAMFGSEDCDNGILITVDSEGRVFTVRGYASEFVLTNEEIEEYRNNTETILQNEELRKSYEYDSMLSGIIHQYTKELSLEEGTVTELEPTVHTARWTMIGVAILGAAIVLLAICALCIICYSCGPDQKQHRPKSAPAFSASSGYNSKEPIYMVSEPAESIYAGIEPNRKSEYQELSEVFEGE